MQSGKEGKRISNTHADQSPSSRRAPFVKGSGLPYQRGVTAANYEVIVVGNGWWRRLSQ
jgi:hypothetical protein